MDGSTLNKGGAIMTLYKCAHTGAGTQNTSLSLDLSFW